MQNPISDIEQLYDTYSPMLYGIALEISKTQSEAEEILMGTFQKIAAQDFVKDDPTLSVTLVKLAIQTAHEQLGNGHFVNPIKLKQFENTPIFHALICEQLSLDNYCEENEVDRCTVLKMLRKESMSVRKLSMTRNPAFQSSNA